MAEFDAVTRIELGALLSFLKAGVAYQSRVARILRTVTEALHFGDYRNSTKGKLTNLVVSEKASMLVVNCTATEFCRRTILEHPLPLERMYLELLPQALSLDVETVAGLVGRYPLVTVTREENQNLKHRGWTSPADRYEQAGIKAGRLDAIRFGVIPQWTPISLTVLSHQAMASCLP